MLHQLSLDLGKSVWLSSWEEGLLAQLDRKGLEDKAGLASSELVREDLTGIFKWASKVWNDFLRRRWNISAPSCCAR